MVDCNSQLLEINLISAQHLKPTSTNLRRMQTYAVAWVDPTAKLRTRVDRVGGENPTWNDKFIFRVTDRFISNENSAVSIEIYAVGCFIDSLIGTVRLLISNTLSSSGAHSFSALQIRRPSGRFHGVLNVGTMLLGDSIHVALTGKSLTGKSLTAIGYRDLMGETPKARRQRPSRQVSNGEKSAGESCECSDFGEYSGGCSEEGDSRALKERNVNKEMGGEKERSDGGGMSLCGLGIQRKIHLSPSDQNLQSSVSDESGS